MKPADVEALARKLGKEITRDLFTGQRRAAVESTFVRALKRNRSRGGPPRTGRAALWDADATFLAVTMTYEELAAIKRQAARQGLGITAYARAAFGLPPRRQAP